MQFCKVHLLQIFRPLFRMQLNLHYTLVVIPGMCVCVRASVYGMNRLYIQFHLIFFTFCKIQMSEQGLQKNVCNWKFTRKFIQNIHFKLKIAKNKPKPKISSEKSYIKLKLENYFSSTVRFVERWFELECLIFTFQSGQKPHSRPYQLVNDCGTDDDLLSVFSLFTFHSFEKYHYKLSRVRMRLWKRERERAGAHSAGVLSRSVRTANGIEQKKSRDKNECFFRFSEYILNEKKTMLRMHDCSQNHIPDIYSPNG